MCHHIFDLAHYGHQPFGVMRVRLHERDTIYQKSIAMLLLSFKARKALAERFFRSFFTGGKRTCHTYNSFLTYTQILDNLTGLRISTAELKRI